MKYKCVHCNYETDDLSNFTKHKQRPKHLINVKKSQTTIINPQVTDVSPSKLGKEPNILQPKIPKKLTCDYCDITFSSSHSLSRHLNICSSKIIENKDAIIKEKDVLLKEKAELLKEKEKRLKEMAREKDKRIEELLKEKESIINEKNNLFEYLKTSTMKHIDLSQINSTANLSSVNALTFLMTHRKNAPPLRQIDHTDAIKILNYDETESTKHIESLIFEFRKKHFAKMIAGLIVNQYKTANPDNQSFWSTDVARLSYLIRDVAQQNAEPTWITDKKGVKLTNYVLTPILDAIYQLLDNYIKKITILNKSLSKVLDIDYDQINRNITLALSASELMNYIKRGTLTIDILSELAPKFNLDKSLCIKANIIKKKKSTANLEYDYDSSTSDSD